MSTPMTSAPDARLEFSERVRRANYLEYWDADYRTDKPTTNVLPYVWPWDEMKSLMLESAKLIAAHDNVDDILIRKSAIWKYAP